MEKTYIITESEYKKVMHCLWQLSMGTTGFEEATEFSKYTVGKAKEIIGCLSHLKEAQSNAAKSADY